MAKIVSTGRTISTSEYLEKRNRARRKKYLVFCALFLMLLAALIMISRLPSLQIKEVSVAGAVATGPDAVVSSVGEKLAGRYLWLIPRSNALIYSKGEIKTKLARDFPRLSGVALSLDGLERLVVSVVEREPHALYCWGEANTCYFLDETGFIFDLAPTFSEGVYFTYFREPVLVEPLGQPLFPKEEFGRLETFVSALRSFGFDPLSLTLGESDIRLSLSGGAQIFWSRTSDLERTLANLGAFLNSSAIKAQKDFLEKVAELDLRTEDKVFYRFNE